MLFDSNIQLTFVDVQRKYLIEKNGQNGRRHEGVCDNDETDDRQTKRRERKGRRGEPTTCDDPSKFLLLDRALSVDGSKKK